MSGGFFNGDDYTLESIADQIERAIERNKTPDEYGYSTAYNNDTISLFKQTSNLLRLAGLFVHRIDWLLEGDDGEDSFFTRLQEDLAEFSLDASDVDFFMWIVAHTKKECPKK